jgi:hypothetical protein
MRLSGLLKWIGLLTVLSLVYIHMQMKIIHLAYEGKHKEKTIRSLTEENGYLTYGILSMKSVNNLGDKLLSKNSGMDFVGTENIVVFDQAAEIAMNTDAPKERSNFVLGLLTLGSQAEARSR